MTKLIEVYTLNMCSFLYLIGTPMKLSIKQHRVNDLKSVSPVFVDVKKPLVLWKVHAPGPAAEASVKHQVNSASNKAPRNSHAQGNWETLVWSEW